MAGQAYIYGGIAALELAGGYFASQNIKETAQLNKEIADMNAEFAELDAYDALIQGETDQVRYQSVIDQTLSDQNAIAAAQGVDLEFGSAGALREEDKFIAELNMMEIEKRAEEQALGFKEQAAQYRKAGILGLAQSDVQARQVMFQSGLGAAKTGLTGYARSK